MAQIDLTEARVYVDTYKKYNEGKSGGEWVYLNEFDSYDEFIDHITELHSDEDSPEFMFTDYSELPSGLISESHLNEKYWDIKDHEHGDLIAEWAYNIGIDIVEAYDNFDDYFVAEDDDDFDEFLWEIIDSYELPNFARTYFDFESYKRDVLIGDMTEVGGAYFRNY